MQMQVLAGFGSGLGGLKEDKVATRPQCMHSSFVGSLEMWLCSFTKEPSTSGSLSVLPCQVFKASETVLASSWTESTQRWR